MTRRWLAGLAAIGAIAFAMVGYGVPRVSAQSAAAPDEQGWWTVTNPGSPLPSPPAPDVPAGGLLVQGGTSASKPAAYAALIYFVPSGDTASALTLDIAPKSATTSGATLEICPLVQQTFVPEQGGPMSDAPAYSCTLHSTASPSAGSKYVFPAASLANGGVLAVAVLPTKATDRVVFAKPGDQSLGFVSSPTDTTPAATGQALPPASGPTRAPSAPQAAPTNTPAASVAPVPVAAAGTGPSLAPAEPGGSSPVHDSGGSTSGAATAQGSGNLAAVSFGTSKANPFAVGAAIAAVVALAALWAIARRGRDPSRSPNQ
jgi:hypothetical protein